MTKRSGRRRPISLGDVDAKQRLLENEIQGDIFSTPPLKQLGFKDDRRNDKQERLFESKNRIIALDPGVRKFLVGYDPTGKATFFGQGACRILTTLLLELDKVATVAH